MGTSVLCITSLSLPLKDLPVACISLASIKVAFSRRMPGQSSRGRRKEGYFFGGRYLDYFRLMLEPLWKKIFKARQCTFERSRKRAGLLCGLCVSPFHSFMRKPRVWGLREMMVGKSLLLLYLLNWEFGIKGEFVRGL